MSSEADNVAILKDTYQRLQDSKAGSVDYQLGPTNDGRLNKFRHAGKNRHPS